MSVTRSFTAHPALRYWLEQEDNPDPGLAEDQTGSEAAEMVPPPTASAIPPGRRTGRGRVCKKPSYLHDYVTYSEGGSFM